VPYGKTALREAQVSCLQNEAATSFSSFTEPAGCRSNPTRRPGGLRLSDDAAVHPRSKSKRVRGDPEGCGSLLRQIRTRALLLLIHPARDGNEQEAEMDSRSPGNRFYTCCRPGLAVTLRSEALACLPARSSSQIARLSLSGIRRLGAADGAHHHCGKNLGGLSAELFRQGEVFGRQFVLAALIVP